MKLRSKYLAGQVISGNQLEAGFPIRFNKDGIADVTEAQAQWILDDAQFSKFVDLVPAPAKNRK